MKRPKDHLLISLNFWRRPSSGVPRLRKLHQRAFSLNSSKIHPSNCVRGNNQPSLYCERGVSLLELALILPVILLLIVGFIEFGWALRDLQILTNSSREGARAAAAHARPRPAKPCHDANVGLASINCGDPAQLTVLPNDAINVAAKKSTCQYLNNASLPGSDWDVNTQVRTVSEDGTNFQIIQVTVDRGPNARRCLICWERFTSIIRFHRESSFALEGSCS